MKTILCPTDFSENAQGAVRYAAKLASVNGASLFLLHARHVPIVDAYAPASTMTTMMDDAFQAAEKRMSNYAEEVAHDHQIRVESRVAFGLLSDMVEELESSQPVDLVVLGTRGAGNAVNEWLGTTASQIMQVSKAPTIVIPGNAEYQGLRRVGYATDFSSDSDMMIEQFANMMKPFNAEVFVVHVSTSSDSSDELDRIIKHFENASDPVTIKGENIAEELNAFIWDNSLNLLALKRHKRNWFDNLFHKSITKEMIYHSNVPVLVFN